MLTTDDGDRAHRPVRVLLADCHALFREAVRQSLENGTDIVVVAEAQDGPEAMSAIRLTRPDVVLADSSLRQAGDLRFPSALQEDEGPRLVILGDTEDADVAVAALEGGCAGFLPKTTSLSSLVSAVESAARGETVLPPSMLTGVLDRLLRRRSSHDKALRVITHITPRERAVLALLADGASNASIGTALGISPETARTHVQNLLRKLGVHSKLEAAAFVIQHGIRGELLEIDGDSGPVPQLA